MDIKKHEASNPWDNLNLRIEHWVWDLKTNKYTHKDETEDDEEITVNSVTEYNSVLDNVIQHNSMERANALEENLDSCTMKKICKL